MMTWDLKKSILKMISNPEILRTYISDWTTYQKIIIERYEQKSSDEKAIYV